MTEPVPEDKITLSVLVEGDNVYKNLFVITVSSHDMFVDIRGVIQKAYSEREQTSIYGLDFYRANVPFNQVENFQLSDEAFLPVVETVGSVWPSRFDVDRRLVHIIVRPKSKQVTQTCRAVAPPAAEAELDTFIKEFNDTQLKLIRAVKKTSSSSAAMPKTFRVQQAGLDYINIGRPAEKTWLPIVLYHPVFGHFLRRLRSTDPLDPEVYMRTSNYFHASQDLYVDETNPQARDEITQSRLLGVLGKSLANGVQKGAGPEAGIHIMEMRNELGTGPSDPSIQAAQSYARYWADKADQRWLKWCCCPSILVVIAGPWMCVLGAIFLDRPVVQPLTHFLWVGTDPARPSELDYIARVFNCLSVAWEELEEYYRSSNPPGETPARAFPYPTHCSNSAQVMRFTYQKILCPGKPIFLAETIEANPKCIVVKFVKTYNGDTHRLLAEHRLAPELPYDGTIHPEDQPSPDFSMIVMKFIQGVDLEWMDSYLSHPGFEDIDKAIALLHAHDFVFGDLREPNVMVLPTGKAMLVDFDWCGKGMGARYPFEMNMDLELGWHRDVGPGAEMRKEHDKYMLEKLRPR
ncbi:unnamed protein product [Rhizoctonia solani]|uniref:Protein kinase domain-containing protein n=1 Tax=Rhizoctonia solani TaxID=456999 RepID=A0A8H3E7Q1_9AGAM|nr:unnamed protein product [Rhizoctonia solani]